MSRLEPEDPASVLVAIDGRAAGWAALGWAALEASARACPLRIVQVFKWPSFALDAYGQVQVREWDPAAFDAALALLDDATERARQTSPDLHITTQLEAGSVVSTLLSVGGSESLLVVGRSRPLGWLRPAPWSVSWQIARRSATAVVLVGVSGGRSAAASPGGIVVAVEDADAALDAVPFALATARRWGSSVTALVPPRTKNLLGDNVDTLLRSSSKAFPEVHIRERVVAGPFGPTMAEASLGAALVVLGVQRRGRFDSAFGGSVAGELVREIDGPLAFVRARTGQSRSTPESAA
jgi:nucleotide-binding universal stress UspA family protein